MATTEITLVNNAQHERSFGVAHATALLAYEEVNGLSNWAIKPDTGYYYSNGIIYRSNKGANKKPKEPGKP
jgi:hypothetical protein